MKKIYISPSDQTANAYAAGGTTEAVECRKTALFLVDALQRCGMEAMTNLTASMQTRVAESNAWGADLHVCLHTNAYNGQVTGTRLFTYSMEGEGADACRAVMAALAPITPGASDNITARPELYECRAANAPCVYIETEFHDVPSAALWIIENTQPIAEAICKGICDHYGIAYILGEEEAEMPRYQTLEELPEWAKAETQELIELGALKGNDKGLDVTEDMLRTMLVNLRAAKALTAK